MHPVALLFMFAGLMFSVLVGYGYSLVFLVSLILFWLYSTPVARWKGKPHLSLIAIGISTGFNSVLMGALAAGGAITMNLLLGATGASMILLSLYPVSQIFQMEDDRKREDQTFALTYGVEGVKKFFFITFTSGSLLLFISVIILDTVAGLLLLCGIIISGTVIAHFITRMAGNADEYSIVMKTKFFASLSFVCFFLAGNMIRHGWFGA